MAGVNFGTEPYLIRIGDHVTVSFDVCFITHDGATWVFRDTHPNYRDITRYGPIRIYDNVFIGARVIIMPNVSIGPNSIVAAGAIVTSDIPPNMVYGGIPAKPLMSLDEYVSKCVNDDQKIPPFNKQEVLRAIFSKTLNE
ncbi:MAG: acyltransferase [Gammaproteobacteria bacterium]|nr:acyltransferase [Gammaproteobacteria bacterium]